MKTTFLLNVPTPCHERWDDFTPTPTGGFCNSCQKNVIDFTSLSDSQLVAFFRDLSADKKSLCGRFRNDQLQKNYDINAWFPEWHVKANTLSYEVPVSKTRPRIKLPVIQKMKAVRTLTMAVLSFVFVEQGDGQRQLTGLVADNEGVPLPGVNILIKGTQRGITSDADGKYELTVEDHDTLIYSFIGYKQNKLKATDVKSVVKMEEDISLLDEVVVMGYSTSTCRSFTGGLIVLDTIEEQDNIIESDFRKYATQLKVLGNPTVNEEVTIIPQVHENSVFANSEERGFAEDWYAKNGFQHIENVQVYDISGRIFETTYSKVDDGKIVVNLKNVPSGLCIVRITYSNEKSLEEVESAAVRLIVEK